MSTIRIIILTTLILLLATLPSQPTRALDPSDATQFSCANVSEIPQPECEAGVMGIEERYQLYLPVIQQ